MVLITEQSTVAEVARTAPAVIRLLEEYGIDFCCGGNRPIGDSCREKGIAFGALVEAIQKAQESPAADVTDLSSVPLGELIDYIVLRHHTYLRNELPRLSRILTKVTEVHGRTYGEFLVPLGKVFVAFWRELEDHMWKEENVLFPLIRRMEESRATTSNPPRISVSDPIRVMEFEHQSAGNALNRMRQLTNQYETPSDGCTTFRALMDGLREMEADLHQHIHLENNILFPKATEMEGSV